MRRKLAAGNWKMNGTLASLGEVQALSRSHTAPKVDILLCPPTPLIWPMASARDGDQVMVGAQDCHANTSGAHTGDVSAAMVKEAGATAVILGHSERRTDHGETSELVENKVNAVWKQDLLAVICLGETLKEREDGDTLAVVGEQLAASTPEGANGENTVIAYEPVWAIGTGLVPTLDQIAEVHDFLRAELTARFGETTANDIRLLYGGSVKASNAAEIFAVSNVDGALVGGASLKADDFSPIVTALEASV
ncbi:triose-phosphate isomerase [Aestuariibius sp. HNIBRBA575]|uniref:triose-phosphate isomerase n=1 Tax=Aestuariibius sp. HNIBRBA575 TaxID=3233343 RepID=UPI0034A219A4